MAARFKVQTVCSSCDRSHCLAFAYPSVRRMAMLCAQRMEPWQSQRELMLVFFGGNKLLHSFMSCIRAKTALVTSTNAETLATCKLSSSYLSLNSEIRTTCATTRKHCWLVPLNTTDYFNRCVWTRQETKSQVETCVSPPSLANRSREDLVAAGLWSQCVSRTVVTVTVATEPAQSNPALDLLFSCVLLLLVSDSAGPAVDLLLWLQVGCKVRVVCRGHK